MALANRYSPSASSRERLHRPMRTARHWKECLHNRSRVRSSRRLNIGEQPIGVIRPLMVAGRESRAEICHRTYKGSATLYESALVFRHLLFTKMGVDGYGCSGRWFLHPISCNVVVCLPMVDKRVLCRQHTSKRCPSIAINRCGSFFSYLLCYFTE